MKAAPACAILVIMATAPAAAGALPAAAPLAAPTAPAVAATAWAAAAPAERAAAAEVPTVTMKGRPVQLSGTVVTVGDRAPAFTALDNDFQPVALDSFRGRPVLISAVPSLDTAVCSMQTRRFDDELAGLPEEVALITISMDLPTAQKRFCSEEGIERMVVLSDSALREFGHAYGILIPARGLLARAVFVIDPGGRVVYREVVSEISEQPDYQGALDAVRRTVR
ncbi:MAG: thiol peroxidase [Candidatus Krumholzibacteriia bacterium]